MQGKGFLKLSTIVFLLLLWANAYCLNLQPHTKKLLKDHSFSEVVIEVKEKKYVWAKDGELELLIEKKDDGYDRIVDDEYEAKYVFKVYYMNIYSPVLEIFRNQLLGFNDSRKLFEDQCKNLLGYTIHECVDRTSCYKACYFHPGCNYGLQGGKGENSSIVTASLEFSQNLRELDKEINKTLVQIDDFVYSYDYVFPSASSIEKMRSLVENIKKSALFEPDVNKGGLNYCRPIPYALEYLTLAEKTLGNISNMRLNIESQAKNVSENGKKINTEAGEIQLREYLKVQNLTQIYDAKHSDNLRKIRSAIEKFKYEKYYALLEELEELYTKIKNSSIVEELEEYGSAYDAKSADIDKVIESGKNLLQEISILRNSASNIQLNAKKERYDEESIAQKLAQVDKILSKDRITDRDINMIKSLLEEVRNSQPKEGSESFMPDVDTTLLETIIPFGLGLVVIAVFTLFGMKMLKSKKNLQLVLAEVIQQEDGSYVSTFSIELKKNNQPVQDGTKVKIIVASGATTDGVVENGFVNLTLTFTKFPKDTDITLITDDNTKTTLRVHFVLGKKA